MDKTDKLNKTLNFKNRHKIYSLILAIYTLVLLGILFIFTAKGRSDYFTAPKNFSGKNSDSSINFNANSKANSNEGHSDTTQNRYGEEIEEINKIESIKNSLKNESYFDNMIKKLNLSDENLNGKELSLDFEFCEELKERYSPYANISVLAIGWDGLLRGFYSSVVESMIGKDELSQVFSFVDVSKSRIFETLRIAAMIEYDDTLLEEYYCEGKGVCDEAHGLVNLSNILTCQSAIDNLRKNYKDEDLLDDVYRLGVLSRDLEGLINLAFLSYRNEMIPPFQYINYSDAISLKRIELKPLTKEFLRSVVQEQVEGLKIFEEDGKIFIVVENLREPLKTQFARLLR